MNGSENLFIPLPLTPGAEGVYLRSLCGSEELSVEDTNTGNLIYLLESLIEKGAAESRVNAAQIVTADRDRLLAILYISLYGSKVESTLSCQNCGEKFDLDFSLYDLLNQCQPELTLESENGIYVLDTGISFRLPNGEDEMLINGLTNQEAERLLLDRCLVNRNPECDKEAIQLRMSEIAPVLNLVMKAICPECSHSQNVQFDIQSFFLLRLKQERPLLIEEIHSIASHYHWSQKEILELPRNLRKQYAALIQSEK